MRSWKVVSVWLVVTAVVTFTAWQVVQAASDRVNEVPLAPVVALGPQSSATTTTPDSTTSTTTTLPGSSTSSSSTSTSTTSTTRPQSTPPTQPAPRGTATIPSAGGTVTVTYSNGQVFFAGATPAVGFAAEVKNQGPQEVRVEFESEVSKVDIRVRWSGGALVTDISSDD